MKAKSQTSDIRLYILYPWKVATCGVQIEPEEEYLGILGNVLAQVQSVISCVVFVISFKKWNTK